MKFRSLDRLNKKAIILTFFSVLLIFSATGQDESSELLKMMEQNENSKDISIDLVNQTTSKDQTGNYANLKLNISFKGFQPSNNSSVRLAESPSFNLKDDLYFKKKIKDLKKINENKESCLVDYRINISDETNERSIYVRYLSENNELNFTKDVNVSIKGLAANFDFSVGKISEKRITGNLENIGDNSANSIHVTLIDQPGIVREGVKTKVLGNLDQDEEKIVDFGVSNISVGENYRFKINYIGENNLKNEFDENIEIYNLSKTPVKAKLRTTNSSGVFYKVENTDKKQISSVVTSLEASKVNISGGKTQRVGNISSKDKKFATYKITHSEVTETELKIFYTDSTGMRRTTTQAVRLPNSSEIKNISTNPENNLIGEFSVPHILISLGGLLIIITYLNHRRKQEKEEKSFQEFETDFLV